MASLFSKPKKPKVDKPNTENQLLAAYAAAEKMKKRAGQRSTIMTSPLGVTGDPSTVKATLGA
jgi:hypothetical protein